MKLTFNNLFCSQKGRLRRWGAREEELASLKFDLKTDLDPLLNSYNTKQLFVYLTASFDDVGAKEAHEVVLWDRIITRGDIRDLRSVSKSKGNRASESKSKKKKGRARRGRVWVEEAKNKYPWKMPSGTFGCANDPSGYPSRPAALLMLTYRQRCHRGEHDRALFAHALCRPT